MAIVFIGPWCAGKTTWAKKYAQWAGKDFVDLVDILTALKGDVSPS